MMFGLFSTRSAVIVMHIAMMAEASISPKTAVAGPNSELRVTCNYDPKTPLDKCLFRVWLENDRGESPDTAVMDFSSGSETKQLVRRRDNNDVNFKANYLGEGLHLGECGVNFSSLTEGRYFVGCRAHFVNGEWIYDFMTLFVNSQGGTPPNGDSSYVNQTVEHTKASNAFVFTAPENIQECQVFLPDQPPFTLNRDNGKKVTDVYEGNLDGRKCSVKLLSVTLRASGPIWAFYKEFGNLKWKAFAPQIINVQAIPGPATLEVNNIGNENITATCSVPPGRPAARIRWTVDGKVNEPNDDRSATAAWAWPWDPQPVEQQLKITLDKTQEHTVDCHVFYPDLNTKKEMLTRNITGTGATTTPVPSTPSHEPPQSSTTTDKPDVPADSDLTWLWVCLALAAIGAVLGGLGFKFREKLFKVFGVKNNAGPTSNNPPKGEADAIMMSSH